MLKLVQNRTQINWDSHKIEMPKRKKVKEAAKKIVSFFGNNKCLIVNLIESRKLINVCIQFEEKKDVKKPNVKKEKTAPIQFYDICIFREIEHVTMLWYPQKWSESNNKKVKKKIAVVYWVRLCAYVCDPCTLEWVYLCARDTQNFIILLSSK